MCMIPNAHKHTHIEIAADNDNEKQITVSNDLGVALVLQV